MLSVYVQILLKMDLANVHVPVHAQQMSIFYGRGFTVEYLFDTDKISAL